MRHLPPHHVARREQVVQHTTVHRPVITQGQELPPFNVQGHRLENSAGPKNDKPLLYFVFTDQHGNTITFFMENEEDVINFVCSVIDAAESISHPRVS